MTTTGADVVPALLNANSEQNALQAFDFPVSDEQWKQLNRSPDFLTTLPEVLEKMFETDPSQAQRVLESTGRTWPLFIRKRVAGLLLGPPFTARIQARIAARSLAPQFVDKQSSIGD